MLRKALTIGIAFILALSLLFSMTTCFTHDAEAHVVFPFEWHTHG